MIAGLRVEWADGLDIVKSHVVRIETPGGWGTGFLIAKYRTFNVIASAYHVIDHAYEWEEPIKIISQTPEEKVAMLKEETRVIIPNKEQDLACIVLHKSELALPDKLLPLPEEGKALRVGIVVGWCGYPAIMKDPPLCFFTGPISAQLKKEESYLVDGVAINGVSGGPAFSISMVEGEKSAVLRGLLTAYIPNRATGEPLPGVSLIRSINSFFPLLKKFSDKEKEQPELPQAEANPLDG